MRRPDRGISSSHQKHVVCSDNGCHDRHGRHHFPFDGAGNGTPPEVEDVRSADQAASGQVPYGWHRDDSQNPAVSWLRETIEANERARPPNSSVGYSADQ